MSNAAYGNEYILSFDPGKSSGVALLGYNESGPWLEKAYQVEGGLSGLQEWLHQHTKYHMEGADALVIENLTIGSAYEDWRDSEFLTVISEKFTPLSGGSFHLTIESMEPVRIEGALVFDCIMPDYPDPQWRRPDRMYLYGGKTLAEKKKRASAFLKANGFYVTGKDVGCKDANDARSSMLHGLSYLAQVKEHRPTFDLIAKFGEANAVA